MTPITIEQLRRAVDAQPLGTLPAGPSPITSICTDSRSIQPGCLFIALPGQRYDGHDFLPHAAAGGAAAALIQTAPNTPPPRLPLLRVKDTRRAMGLLASHLRAQLAGKVIAIAGSNGKTGTKLLLHTALASRLHGTASPKSYNNDIGVPLAIFPAGHADDYLILEMGTNHPGEIAHLARMARPDIAIITSIGHEHLEGLGDLDGVRRENASIIQGLNPHGALILNGDDPHLLDATAGYPGQRIAFGLQDHNTLRATRVHCTENGVSFHINDAPPQVFIPLLGRHNALNALAAIAAARLLGVPDDAAIAALASAPGPEMRLQLQKINGLTILNDAYNANPDSMHAALETLQSIKPIGRRIAILGDMLELGPTSFQHHREVGRLAAASRLDALVCIGPLSQHTAQAASQAGLCPTAISHYPDAKAAAQALQHLLRPADLVLLKASRGIQLETILAEATKALRHEGTKGSAPLRASVPSCLRASPPPPLRASVPSCLRAFPPPQ